VVDPENVARQAAWLAASDQEPGGESGHDRAIRGGGVGQPRYTIGVTTVHQHGTLRSGRLAWPDEKTGPPQFET